MSTQRTLAFSYLAIGLVVALTLEQLLSSIVGQVGFLSVLNREILDVGGGRPGELGWTWTTVIAFAIAIGLGVFAWRDARVRTPATEVVQELQRVTWPTAAETRAATWAVVVATAIVAVLLGAFDYGWTLLTDKVYSP